MGLDNSYANRISFDYTSSQNGFFGLGSFDNSFKSSPSFSYIPLNNYSNFSSSNWSLGTDSYSNYWGGAVSGWKSLSYGSSLNFGLSDYSYNSGWNCGWGSFNTLSLGDFSVGSSGLNSSASFYASGVQNFGVSSLGVGTLGSLTSRTSSGGRVSGNFSYRRPANKEKLGPEFLEKVKRIADRINCDYKDLLAVMNSESGLDHTVQNSAGYQAYGLIQFTPDAAADIGTTIPALMSMTALEQLDYVEKFYLKVRQTRGFGNRRFTAGDLYAATFLPARANQDVLCVKGERWESGKCKGKLKNWYEANSVFDGNGDGKIEKWELTERMNQCRVNESMFVA